MSEKDKPPDNWLREAAEYAAKLEAENRLATSKLQAETDRLRAIFKAQTNLYHIRLSGGWLTLEAPDFVNEQDVKVLRKLCDVIEESSRLCAEAACEGSGEKEDIEDE